MVCSECIPRENQQSSRAELIVRMRISLLGCESALHDNAHELGVPSVSPLSI